MWENAASVLVVGARGMLGQDLLLALRQKDQPLGEISINAVDVQEMDITNPSSVEAGFARFTPQLVVNCAAYTDVDGSETHRDQAFAVNADGPRHLAQACRTHHAKLIHLSTDFVFNGRLNRPYRPEDPPDPQGVYAQSKLAGERTVQENSPDHLIVRTSWLYGRFGKNFVTTIYRLACQRPFLEVVNDQFGWR